MVAMLVMLGPSFEGQSESYDHLARATGLVAYDLRTRLKPGSWGVLKALADERSARDLWERLHAEGFPVVLVDPARATDAERRFVPLERLELLPTQIRMQLRGRHMEVPYGALLAIVRGEVGSGSRPPPVRGRAPSSSTFRAVVPSAADLQVFRENSHGAFDSYQAADLHFITVRWAARIDARSFDFSDLEGGTGNGPRDLDLLVERLAEHTGIRIDRGARASSLASFASTLCERRPTPPPGARPAAPRALGRFDTYSGLVAEAELAARRLRKR